MSREISLPHKPIFELSSLNKTLPHYKTIILHKIIPYLSNTSGKWLCEHTHSVAFISADIYSPH